MQKPRLIVVFESEQMPLQISLMRLFLYRYKSNK